jgi:hypothetical protein
VGRAGKGEVVVPFFFYDPQQPIGFFFESSPTDPNFF